MKKSLFIAAFGLAFASSVHAQLSAGASVGGNLGASGALSGLAASSAAGGFGAAANVHDTDARADADVRARGSVDTSGAKEEVKDKYRDARQRRERIEQRTDHTVERL